MYRVLLVDDESLTLDYLKMAIPKQDPDWEIAGACLDGIQALEWFESHSADLVLTDIKMPEMSGWSSASGFTAGIQNRKLSFYPAMTNLNSHSRPFSAVWRIIY